jgi:hypothetical protein
MVEEIYMEQSQGTSPGDEELVEIKTSFEAMV